MPCWWLKFSAWQASAMISIALRGGIGPVVVHDVAQRDPVDVLHDDVGQRARRGLRLAGVVHRDDRGMVQRGGVLRLPAEPQVEARVAGQVGAQHLDRHVAVQPQIARQMNLGHAAEAEDLAEFVAVGQVLWGRHRVVLVACGAGRAGRGATAGWYPILPSVTAGRVGVQFWVVAGGQLGGFGVGSTPSLGRCLLLVAVLDHSRTAITMASAPSTPAAHSSAR